LFSYVTVVIRQAGDNYACEDIHVVSLLCRRQSTFRAVLALNAACKPQQA